VSLKTKQKVLLLQNNKQHPVGSNAQLVDRQMQQLVQQ
jgi:hypothetical protein